MTFIQVIVIVGMILAAGYYFYDPAVAVDNVGTGLNTAADYFIEKSNQAITVIDYWANGPRQNNPTSGSESISFDAVDDSIIEDEQMILPPIVQPTQEEKELKMCEENFKTCVDSAHATYGVFIIVNKVKTFNDNSAEEFFNSRKSEYQPAFDTIKISYPIILVSSEAVGLGQFVAECKDGIYPKDLNTGLPY